MVILNANGTEKTLKSQPFVENLKSFSGAREVVHGKDITDLSSFTIQTCDVLVLELKRLSLN
jgi:hypothetical protein